MRAAACCLLLLSGQTALAEDAPVIGRLFAPAGGKTADLIRVDGAVARSSGRNTIWLNGQAHPQAGNTLEGARTNPAQLPAVTLKGNHPVRVGETLDRENSKRQDILPAAAVVRKERQ